MARNAETRGWPLKERLEHFSEAQSNGCRLWTGAKDKDGYGWLYYEGGNKRAHRLALFVRDGVMPRGFACHRCDTPSCINPDHLFVGTNRDNCRDMARKGRHGMLCIPRETIEAIRASPESSRKAGARFGVSPGYVSHLRLEDRRREVA